MKVWARSALNLIGHSGEHRDPKCAQSSYTNKQVPLYYYFLCSIVRTLWAVTSAMLQKTNFSKTAEHPDVWIVVVQPTLIEWLSISLLIGLSIAAIKRQAI